MERTSTLRVIMKPLERPMAGKKALFDLGSSLDSDKGWKLSSEKTVLKSSDIKPPEKHFLVLKMEKRVGKPISLVGPFFLSDGAMNLLCSKIKKKLGSGGTCKEAWMEFQGECREKLRLVLMQEGYRFK